MLRITKKKTANGPRLILEGRVVGAWVQVLNQECDAMLNTKDRLSVDLSQVSFVDRDGAALLKKLADRNVQFIHCPALIAELCKR